jgi:hypothetical protein
MNEGLRLYAHGRIHDALLIFFEELGDNSGNAVAHYMCGLALQSLGLTGEAQTEWRHVLSLVRKTEGDMDVEAQWVRHKAEEVLAISST